VEGQSGEALAGCDVDAAFGPDALGRAAALLLLPPHRDRHAAAAEVETDITWHGDRAAHFVSNMMSQGAALVDDFGVVRMRAAE
jgi:hypothetical protein